MNEELSVGVNRLLPRFFILHSAFFICFWKPTVLFLPSYSPDLNPIEHLWAACKTRLRKELATAANPFLFIANMCQCYC
jgi:transposase